jgi:predicted esterase
VASARQNYLCVLLCRLSARALPSLGWRVYSRSVRKLLLFFVPFVLLAAPVSARQAATGENREVFPVGTVVPKVVAQAKPDQTYALFLPSKYSPQKLWPIVYAFDPGARGKIPVALMQDAAERYGYIVVGSNNSRNGSWKIEAEAAQTMLLDTQERLAIDVHRAYFAGFSGGARVAARLAQLCKCAAGVLVNGAGFQPEDSGAPDSTVAVFAAVGTYDFNYAEIVRMDDGLEKLRYAHFLRTFDGPHQWAPSSSMGEALAWFRLQAMKSHREDKDDSFVAEFAKQKAARAHTFEQTGELYLAWKEYRQAAEAIGGLTDNGELLAKARALEKDKTVRESAKREKQEFEEQDRLTGDISSGLAALRENQPDRTEIRTDIGRKIFDLRDRAEHEKRAERLRILKRALAGVMVQAMEAGFDRLEQKDPAKARDYFDLACEADPDSAWAQSNLAVARALGGDRKGALEALRRAKSKSKEPAQFMDWLKDEPAFMKLRGTSEFNALLESPAEH